MGQTKRKRRTKHRGNAAGTVEARGRTGRKPEPAPSRKGRGAVSSARAARGTTPPTWKSAAAKAAFGALMLFVFVRLGILGEKATTVNALTLCFFAAVLYTPVMYATDRFIYQRKQRALTPRR